MTAQAIDDVLAGTFPASDPPPWTPGVARPASNASTRPSASARAPADPNDARAGVLVVLRPALSEGTFPQTVGAFIGAMGLALLVPFAVLAVGVPVALGVRGVLETAAWFVAIVR